MYIKRAIEPVLRMISETFPVLFVTGPRQVDKATLLQHIAEPERQYVTLDDPMLRQLAKNEPELFLERFEAPVIIDEIQYVASSCRISRCGLITANLTVPIGLSGPKYFISCKT